MRRLREVCRLRGSFCLSFADVSCGGVLGSMAALVNTTRLTFRLAIAMLLATVGCARCQSNCDTCGGRCPLCSLARATYHGTLADEVICGDSCVSQGRPYRGRVGPKTCGPDCQCCPECSLCPLGLCDGKCQRPTPGPAPATLRPCLPPKFLPVPAEPVVSPARPDAPEPARGDVETSYRNQLTSPGRD
jgi:hypothetical protein